MTEAGDATALLDLQAQLDEHRAALASLLAEVRRLREVVRAAGLEHSPAPATPSWSWRELSGEARRRAWTELAAWVDWLVAAYRFERWWSGDWYRLPGLVEEIKALHGFHLAVSALPARGPDYFAWHDALRQFAARGPELMVDPRRPGLGAGAWRPTVGSPEFTLFLTEQVTGALRQSPPSGA